MLASYYKYAHLCLWVWHAKLNDPMKTNVLNLEEDKI